MKAPSSLELLGVQTQTDADLMLAEYPEWFALPTEARVTCDGETTQDRLRKIKALKWIERIFVLSVILTALIAFLR